MPPPVQDFWETTDLLLCILSLLSWQDIITASHVNQRLRYEAQTFTHSRINALLAIFMPFNRIAHLLDELDVSGAAITGELPLALITGGPYFYEPMGNVLEFVVPLGKLNQLLRLFRRIGYRLLTEDAPAHVEISSSTGLAQVCCLEMMNHRNPSDSRWVVLKESASSSWWFALLHTSQTSDMNAITSRAVFMGDSTSAASNMNERQDIQELDTNHLFMTPCGADCPSASRITTDLKGFGQFVYCPSRGPPMPNPQYMWSREGVCYNQRCDNFEIYRDLTEMPTAPDDLYLTADMSVRLAIALQTGNLTDSSSTHDMFKKNFWHFMTNVCAIYHLDTATQLFEALRLANAVLGGSCALYVFCPTSIWPQNLDFFLPKQDLSNPLSDLLLAHGYCLLLNHLQSYSESFSDMVDRSDIYVHSITKRLIRLVYANSSSPLGPLLDAHSTLVLNYISWNSAVCLYPTPTLQRIGFRLQRHNYAIKAFEKYIQRGFILRPQLHPLVPENLGDLSKVENGSALILGFNGRLVQFEEISWLLPSNATGQGGVFIAENGSEKFSAMHGSYMVYP